MSGKVCYLGDDHLQGAAAYLAGILLHGGVPFDYVPSAESPPKSFADARYAAYVIGDYPAARFSDETMARIAARVEQGAGLLMIGGWESFFGLAGEYNDTPLADVLPVNMQSSDDRCNCAQPCLVEKLADHEILAALPWDQPPTIGGYNAVTAKPQAEVLLAAARYSVNREGTTFHFERAGTAPLSIVGRHGAGRTAALATDVAPHWVGGLVDWGDRRIVQAADFGTIEVGNWYAQFFHNLVAWTASL